MREKQENWEKSQNESREFLEKEEEEEEEKPKTTRRTRAPPRDRGNFVPLNLKRKSYSRASIRGKFLRKQVWKQKWRKKFGGGADVCFRCGGKGHWASECRAERGVCDGSSPENSQLPLDSMDFPELEFSPPPPLDPLYPLNPDGTVPDPPEEVLQALRILGLDSIENPIENPYPPEEVLQALRILGFDSFRPGQAEAVMRILCGLSTLLLLPTGSGQSLCSQLPAFLYHRRSRCISIVVSPLISLMDDQVSGLPSALTGIHSNLTPSQRAAAIRKAVLRMLRRWSSEEFGNLENSGNCGNCVLGGQRAPGPAHQSQFPEVPGMETRKGQREAMQVCAVYHAGLSAERRRRTMRAFMEGRGEDFLELRRHIHENSVDYWVVKALVQRVFVPCKCPEKQENSQEIPARRCRGHDRALPVQELEQSLDLRQEGIETLLTLSCPSNSSLPQFAP
ncbi:ATP-dependent DNA helicase Q4-like [Zonotrichia albicollis]|uniref:ATP-dependent DNA helicase Q4-like n=1 Tax=Zonotrichia albicollis TaxID=44394 RepID=UPI003D80EF8F